MRIKMCGKQNLEDLNNFWEVNKDRFEVEIEDGKAYLKMI